MMIYGARSNGKEHGIVLTKPIVVEFMLDRIGYCSSIDLSGFRVIEPAAGDGAFALKIIARLYDSSRKFGFSFQKALLNLSFYEIDKQMASCLTERIKKQLTEFSAFVPNDLIRVEDFLTAHAKKCDFIIGNPPYVRHENIPEAKKECYRKLFSSFTHRSDLYIAFYEKGLKLLKSKATLSYICSNRWLRNQYGENLRALIGAMFNLMEIIDLEEAEPFEESVIAYPAITTIKNEVNKAASYYKLTNVEALINLELNNERLSWIDTQKSTNWFGYAFADFPFEKILTTIENQGFKIGIGVATGADKVFIRKDFSEIVENELLLPIILSKDLKDNSFAWSGNYILNPFGVDGALIDLDKYPKAKSYFETHREVLSKRHIATKNPNFWFKPIDKISSHLLGQNKILIPDISGNTHLFIDSGEYYPHHNLYYISGSEPRKLKVLAAILMSDFVKKQLLHLGNKMNGGYPRWQSQNLRKLIIPSLSAIPSHIQESLEDAYNRKDYVRINQLLTTEELGKFEHTEGQLTLFEPQVEYLVKAK